jgi:hypothetical protein
MLSFPLLTAMLYALMNSWSLLSITSILCFLSLSLEQADRDLKSILAVSWFIFFSDWAFTIIGIWLLLEICRFISEELSTRFGGEME